MLDLKKSNSFVHVWRLTYAQLKIVVCLEDVDGRYLFRFPADNLGSLDHYQATFLGMPTEVLCGAEERSCDNADFERIKQIACRLNEVNVRKLRSKESKDAGTDTDDR